MVTRTLSQAAVDIIHFAVVFFTVFVIYALSALIIFGKELQHFANFHRALHTTFLVILGDFDWDSMIHVGRPQSYLWFWSLIWLVNLVMLNMLLAIVMDVYTEVRKGILANTHIETMWSQAWEIYINTINNFRGTHVPIKLILRTLAGSDVGVESKRSKDLKRSKSFGSENGDLDEEVPDDEYLTVDSLINQFPRMSEEQALDLLVNAADLNISDNKEETEVMIEHNRRTLEHIRRAIDHLTEEVDSWSGEAEGSYSNGKRSNGKTTDGLDWPLEKDMNGYGDKYRQPPAGSRKQQGIYDDPGRKADWSV
jgi:hypothetical protein